jgi:hypothetical protein
MRGIFWNSEGFKDPKKHRFISDLTREQDLGFIAILETVRKGFHDSVLRNLCGEGIIYGIVKSRKGGRAVSC